MTNPLPSHNTSSTLADETNQTDGSYDYYFSPLSGEYIRHGIQMELDGGSGTVTVVFYGSMDASSTSSTATYQDITYQTWGVTNFTSSDMLVDDMGKLGQYAHIKLTVTCATGGANDSDYTILLTQLFN